MFIVGIDIAKRAHVVSVMTAEAYYSAVSRGLLNNL